MYSNETQIPWKVTAGVQNRTPLASNTQDTWTFQHRDDLCSCDTTV